MAEPAAYFGPGVLVPGHGGLAVARARPTWRMQRRERRAWLCARTPYVWVTPALVALNVLMFLATVVMGVSALHPTTDDLVEWGANYAPLTLEGEYWRIAAATVTHGGLFHLMGNMVVLGLLGVFAERLVGNALFLATYVGASLVSIAAALAAQPYGVCVGASGGVYALFGLVVAFYLRRHRELTRLGFHYRVGLYFVLVALDIGVSFLLPEVSVAAHLAGLAVGLAVGGGLAVRVDCRDNRALAGVLVLLTCLAVTAALTLATPSPAMAANREMGRAAALERALGPIAEDVLGPARPEHEPVTVEDCARIEHEVLGPWEAERVRLLGLQGLERDAAASVTRMLDYMHLRADSWSLACDGIRAGRPDRLEQAAIARRMADNMQSSLASALP